MSAAPRPAAGGVIGPDHPEHPDHHLYLQIRDGVQRLDARLGRSHDSASERMIARLLPLARERGFRRVDHVVLSRHLGLVEAGENVFLVQGALEDPGHKRACITTGEATQTPIEHSLALLREIGDRRRARRIARKQERDDDDEPLDA